MPGAHLLGDRQHHHRERHEHRGDEEVVQEAEEALIHVAGDGVRHEGVRQQREHHRGHRDDRGIQRCPRIIDLRRSICEIMPLPRCRQAEGARLGRCLQRRDDGEIQRDQHGQRQHHGQCGQPPINPMILVECLVFHDVPFPSVSRASAHGCQICSLLLENPSWMNATIARTMKKITALAV